MFSKYKNFIWWVFDNFLIPKLKIPLSGAFSSKNTTLVSLQLLLWVIILGRNLSYYDMYNGIELLYAKKNDDIWQLNSSYSFE